MATLKETDWKTELEKKQNRGLGKVGLSSLLRTNKTLQDAFHNAPTIQNGTKV
jgi:hypothetical protein